LNSIGLRIFLLFRSKWNWFVWSNKHSATSFSYDKIYNSIFFTVQTFEM